MLSLPSVKSADSIYPGIGALNGLKHNYGGAEGRSDQYPTETTYRFSSREITFPSVGEVYRQQ
jgi:hypothetical protein